MNVDLEYYKMLENQRRAKMKELGLMKMSATAFTRYLAKQNKLTLTKNGKKKFI